MARLMVETLANGKPSFSLEFHGVYSRESLDQKPH